MLTWAGALALKAPRLALVVEELSWPLTYIFGVLRPVLVPSQPTATCCHALLIILAADESVVAPPPLDGRTTIRNLLAFTSRSYCSLPLPVPLAMIAPPPTWAVGSFTQQAIVNMC